jgi:hypothetical protein
MLTYSASGPGSVTAAWRLLAEPRRWPSWAPHIAGARGLGTPEVEPGRRGVVRLVGGVPVPARIVAKEPGRSWEWQVGPIAMTHSVTPEADGSRVSIGIEAPMVVEAVLRMSYGPLITPLLRNLARVAARRDVAA